MTNGSISKQLNAFPAQTVSYLYANPSFTAFGIDHPEEAKTGKVVKIMPLGKDPYSVDLDVVFHSGLSSNNKIAFIWADSILTDARDYACACLINWTY